MADILTVEEVQTWAPSLTESDATLLHKALNAAVRRVAPCLTVDDADPDAIDEARLILSTSIKRREDVDSWVHSITTGPHHVTMRDSAAHVSVLAPTDEDALRALCATTSSRGNGPRGHFPPPSGIDHLFHSPRWPR